MAYSRYLYAYAEVQALSCSRLGSELRPFPETAQTPSVSSGKLPATSSPPNTEQSTASSPPSYLFDGSNHHLPHFF